MSSVLNNDNFVSVLPRIIDPGMKFTKESILNSNIKNTTKNIISTENEVIPKKQLTFDKKENLDNSQSQKSNSFLSDYKYIIMIVIISIVILIISYLVYKYFDNKNNPKKIEVSPTKEEVKLLNKSLKNEEVKEYISNYIINEDDEDDEDDEEDKETNIEEVTQTNTEEILQNNVEEITQTNYNMNRDTFNTPIIQKPTSISNTNLSIDTNIILDSNISARNIDNNLNSDIYGSCNSNLESENIDSLLNSLNINTSLCEIDNNENDNENDDSDTDNIPIFEELGYESENSNTNNELEEKSNIKLNNNSVDDVDDDLKYFKKFTKK
jgi:hypothetical protein